jgi:hypothetical protein
LKFVRTRSGKVSAGALAALCLLGPILGYAHMLSVGHATCPEHGELLHVEAAGMGGPAAPPSDAPTESGVASDSSLASESHDHDHCGVISARKTQAAVKSVGPALPVATPQPLRLARQSTSEYAPIALYVLAPKNSPPG